MVSEQELSTAIGGTAYDAGGTKIGTVQHFFVDDRSGEPTWVAVQTGFLGNRHSIAPVAGARFADGALHLPVDRDAVTQAPEVDGPHLDPEQEAQLRRHYAVQDNTVADSAPTVPMQSDPSPPDPARPEAAPTAPATGGAMTRSEERLAVGTERVPTGRARLVRYVVTENVQITVPIRREEIRVEEVPLDAPEPAPDDSLQPTGEGAAAAAGPGGFPDEIVLHAERPVVSVEVVPVERVRLRVDTVAGEETVTGQVQREQIVLDQT